MTHGYSGADREPGSASRRSPAAQRGRVDSACHVCPEFVRTARHAPRSGVDHARHGLGGALAGCRRTRPSRRSIGSATCTLTSRRWRQILSTRHRLGGLPRADQDPGLVDTRKEYNALNLPKFTNEVESEASDAARRAAVRAAEGGRVRCACRHIRRREVMSGEKRGRPFFSARRGGLNPNCGARPGSVQPQALRLLRPSR